MSLQDTYGAKILKTESEKKGVSLRSSQKLRQLLSTARLVSSWAAQLRQQQGGYQQHQLRCRSVVSSRTLAKTL